jgi:putative redox protein
MTEVTVHGAAVGFVQRIETGRHTLAGDEPAAAGGTDQGPSPYEFLLAALGSCTAATLRMYADRKGWPLEAVEVSLTHEKDHAADCADCDTRGGRIDRIARRLRLSGPLDDAQRTRLLEIADRCPVHRTLTSGVRIETVLAG